MYGSLQRRRSLKGGSCAAAAGAVDEVQYDEEGRGGPFSGRLSCSLEVDVLFAPRRAWGLCGIVLEIAEVRNYGACPHPLPPTYQVSVLMPRPPVPPPGARIPNTRCYPPGTLPSGSLKVGEEQPGARERGKGPAHVHANTHWMGIPAEERGVYVRLPTTTPPFPNCAVHKQGPSCVSITSSRGPAVRCGRAGCDTQPPSPSHAKVKFDIIRRGGRGVLGEETSCLRSTRAPAGMPPPARVTVALRHRGKWGWSCRDLAKPRCAVDAWEKPRPSRPSPSPPSPSLRALCRSGSSAGRAARGCWGATARTPLPASPEKMGERRERERHRQVRLLQLRQSGRAKRERGNLSSSANQRREGWSDVGGKTRSRGW